MSGVRTARCGVVACEAVVPVLAGGVPRVPTVGRLEQLLESGVDVVRVVRVDREIQETPGRIGAADLSCLAGGSIGRR
jgi:hypothetical protein